MYDMAAARARAPCHMRVPRPRPAATRPRATAHVCPCAYLSQALTTHECHCGKRMWYKLGFGVLFQNPSAKVGEEAFGIFP